MAIVSISMSLADLAEQDRRYDIILTPNVEALLEQPCITIEKSMKCRPSNIAIFSKSFSKPMFDPNKL